MAKHITENNPEPGEAITLPEITSDQHDYDLGVGTFFRISSDATRKIGGIVFHEGMTNIRLVNVGEHDIELLNQNEGSNATNRVITGNGEDVILVPEDTALLSYDTESAAFRLIA